MLLLVAALLVGACGGDDKASRALFNESASDRSEGAPQAVGAASLSGSGGKGASVALQPLSDRDVVYRAEMLVRVDSVSDATREATDITEAAEGVVFAQAADLEGERESQLTLKVPPEKFQSVLDGVGRLGKVLTRQVSAQDVTDEVVDVEGRLKSAQASADRLRSLLGAAGSAADIVALESELSKRESEIESMQGRLRVLNNSVALATIEVRLSERADVGVSDDVPAPLRALRAGWVSLVNIALVVAAGLAFSVPFLPFVALVWWSVRRFRRRNRSGDRATPMETPAVPGSPES